MTQSGVPVPPGFAITVEAYNQILDTTGLRQQIQQALQTVVSNDVHSDDQASDTIRTLIETVPMPPAVEASIRQAYQASINIPPST